MNMAIDIDIEQTKALLSTLEVAHKRIDSFPPNWGGSRCFGVVHLRISLQTPDQWANGYVENSPACWFSISPKGDGRLVVEQFTRYCGRMPKFRKTTLQPSKLLEKLQAYIDHAVANPGQRNE